MTDPLVLGISCFRDDSSAALVQGGRILAAAEEERSLGIKHAVWHSPTYPVVVSDTEPVRHSDVEVRFFPTTAISSVLDTAGVGLTDIDVVAHDFDYHLRLEHVEAWRAATEHLTGPVDESILRASWLSTLRAIDELGKQAEAEVVHVPHHLAHAASTVFGSSFAAPAFLVVDAMGELESATLGRFDGGNFEILDQVELPDSLGLLYASITAFLGFRPFCDEQKTMGLAGFGSDTLTQQLAGLVSVTGARLSTPNDLIASGALCFGASGSTDHWSRVFGCEPRSRSNPALDRPYPDVAAAVQSTTETVLGQLVDWLLAETGASDLCLAGGVALNSSANGLLARRQDVERLFVHPQSGDSGTALGAALYIDHQSSGRRPDPLRHTRHGRKMTNAGVERVIEAWRLPAERVDDPAACAAALLASGELVGWVQGRAELGPRALGGRSILASPAPGTVSDQLNQVKGRESWRPFGTSLLLSEVDQLLEDPAQAGPFMLTTAVLSAEGRKVLPATTHVDGTTRPQVVDGVQDPLYHALIANVGENSGVAAVLNTSYNLAGSPIADTEADAIRTFACSGIDALIIENYLFRKTR